MPGPDSAITLARSMRGLREQARPGPAVGRFVVEAKLPDAHQGWVEIDRAHDLTAARQAARSPAQPLPRATAVRVVRGEGLEWLGVAVSAHEVVRAPRLPRNDDSAFWMVRPGGERDWVQAWEGPSAWPVWMLGCCFGVPFDALVMAAARCARTVLPLVPRPDPGALAAIEAAEGWVRQGGPRGFPVAQALLRMTGFAARLSTDSDLPEVRAQFAACEAADCAAASADPESSVLHPAFMALWVARHAGIADKDSDPERAAVVREEIPLGVVLLSRLKAPS